MGARSWQEYSWLMNDIVHEKQITISDTRVKDSQSGDHKWPFWTSYKSLNKNIDQFSYTLPHLNGATTLKLSPELIAWTRAHRRYVIAFFIPLSLFQVSFLALFITLNGTIKHTEFTFTHQAKLFTFHSIFPLSFTSSSNSITLQQINTKVTFSVIL